jgi:alpha-glucuronidase
MGRTRANRGSGAGPGRFAVRLAAGLVLCLSAGVGVCEDGYELWLRYVPGTSAQQSRIADAFRGLMTAGNPTPLIASSRAELSRGLAALSGHALPRHSTVEDGTLLIGTPGSVPEIASLSLPLSDLGPEGFLVRSLTLRGHSVTVVAANSDRGVLYGSFALLAQLQSGGDPAQLSVYSAPRVGLRMLDHWDNLDRSRERGYSGQSIWDWWRLPEMVDPRYTDYARANASLGINGAVLNNVAAAPEILSDAYLAKVRALADVLRPWGIRVFLSIRFNSPMALGGLKSADPLDPQVRDWWRATADRIYGQIPDFGGFLVKANSEGQPGPMDYGRTHADGANMLAAALAPHEGVVLWRAFVYSEKDATDRAMQAYRQLQPLDGQFAANVVLQVKNGPIDFQPREPFHPLFGAMPRTSVGLELQITKEYLGFTTHLAYLGPMWEEVLRADTHARGAGSTVARVVDGSLFGSAHSVMAGVANTGTDRNWSGSIFDQANWYAFGRLAWDPGASAEAIAREWIVLTFGGDPKVMAEVLPLMMDSRETVVDYMTPLGLAHLMDTGHHYGPGPWVDDLSRPEWNPVYYHRADKRGIGFDRTASGSNAVAQYAPPVAQRYGELASTPLELLLWFHHLDWDHRLSSGRTVWEELVFRYDRGARSVETMQERWRRLDGHIDAERYDSVAAMLRIQQREARWWRDASIAYFQGVSGRELPAGIAPPAQTLAYYRALKFPYAPGRAAP